MPDEPVVPDTCDNGELQPDARRPSGGTPDEREHGHRIQHHNRSITATVTSEPTEHHET